SGGMRYDSIEVYELSLVAVPALQSARIDPQSIKHYPAEQQQQQQIERIPAGLSKQQISDLRHAEARRALGKSARKPASLEIVHVVTRQLRDTDRQIAAAVLELDQR